MNQENQENEELNNIARKVAAHRFSGDENYSIDPFFIIAIAGLIINISRFIYECNRSKNKEDLFDEIKNPSVMYKLLLHRNIKKKWKSKKDRDSVYKSMIEVSKGLSGQELSCIFNEAEKKQ
jgi:hypothetical protein